MRYVILLLLLTACSGMTEPRRLIDSDNSTAYQGCGTDFGTCALVEVIAAPNPAGGWDVAVIASNLSVGHAVGANQASLITTVEMEEFPLTNSSHPPDYTLTGADGTNLADSVSTTVGSTVFGWQGYVEVSPPGSSDVIAATFSGPIDAQCSSTPSCINNLPQNSGSGTAEDPRLSYRFSPGPIVMRFHLDQFTAPGRVLVSMWPIGTDLNQEAYYLTPTTGTP